MNFPYMYISENIDSIDIENIGNVTLQANNDAGNAWYLSIDTKLGWTTIKTIGPINLSDKKIDYHFMYKYDYQEYSDQKLVKTIDKFLNDPKKMITQVFFISSEEISDILNNLNERC